ncbi:MAG: acyl-CoA dehydrogenase [Alphaproteobacteria bacterium]|nr:MAG: acyl-CoA dehydrogenase [Alphaproteobacteria bacterium]
MAIYNAPLRDMSFLLNDVLQIDKYANLPGFADATPDLISAILEEGAKIAQEVLQPLNQVGDKEGCHLIDGEVKTPTGFKGAYDTFVQGGWSGLTAEPEYGGQGLPNVVGVVVNEMVASANMAFGMYPGLTGTAYSAILIHGSDAQKQTYLSKMISGQWSGTMNLTEPHCGTDLGLMRTKAEPQDDGSYKISGTKIFVSAGEHDLTENIIHLVLARIPGGPDGVKGISLFIVPKFLINDDGSLAPRNGVSCGSLEEKMGIHGNSTCVLNYDQATGYLLGAEHKGMRAMFTMMNKARLGVGLQGLSQSEVSYQNAAAYANERLQGRSISGTKFPDKPADPIIVHPDIRRMLMDQRAFNEGARALLYWTALHGDIALKSPDESEKIKSDDYMDLLTPLIKAYFTDKGFAHAVNAQQVLGGHGYIRESGMEQFVRDARITMIYEGANGIQALDLVGRKLASDSGRAILAFLEELGDFVKQHEGDRELAVFVGAVTLGKGYLEDAMGWLMEHGLKNPDDAGAASTDFLHLFGLVSLAYMWALMAKAAQDKAGGDDPFYSNKLKTARYFVERVFPDAASHLAKLKAGADSMMALDAEAF